MMNENTVLFVLVVGYKMKVLTMEGKWDAARDENVGRLYTPRP